MGFDRDHLPSKEKNSKSYWSSNNPNAQLDFIPNIYLIMYYTYAYKHNSIYIAVSGALYWTCYFCVNNNDTKIRYTSIVFMFYSTTYGKNL